jgi:hypothetical protein
MLFRGLCGALAAFALLVTGSVAASAAAALPGVVSPPTLAGCRG